MEQIIKASNYRGIHHGHECMLTSGHICTAESLIHFHKTIKTSSVRFRLSDLSDSHYRNLRFRLFIGGRHSTCHGVLRQDV